MDLQQTIALKNHFHRGYLVLLQGEKVIDMEQIESQFKPKIETSDNGWGKDKIGYYTIETDGYLHTTDTISISDIEVLFPLDWLKVNPTDWDYLNDVDCYLPINDHIPDIADYVEDLKNAYDEAGD